MNGITGALLAHGPTLTTVLFCAVSGVVWITREVVKSRMRERRERQALCLAVPLVEAGGDAAAVLRALAEPESRGRRWPQQHPAADS